MSTYTTNYNLEKPDSTDDFKDFRSNYNSNMDIIDANLGGGGGGNVDDVLVNGVSVVDGNHDAQITSYKEVTQAEYDALPSSKLTDGIAYFIKDAGGGGGGSSSHNYSTTEQVIGTWIDGKPVYEIVVTGTTIAGGTTTNVAHGISDIDEIVSSTVLCHFSNSDAWRELNFTYNNGTTQNTWYAGYLIDPTNIGFQIGTSFALMLDKWRAIIRYTKTTDV